MPEGVRGGADCLLYKLPKNQRKVWLWGFISWYIPFMKTGELCEQLIKCKERMLDDNSDPDVKKIIVEEINTQLVDLRLGSVAQTGGWLAWVCVAPPVD